MDDRSQPSPNNSRKRLRAEDRSVSSYKLSTSPAMTHFRDPSSRSGTASGPSDIMLPTPVDSAPTLQPLHPPIPNYSAISQSVPRSSAAPPSNSDQPNNSIYNIALPLPNPGRAHRFCQVCDHVNHVRRKLCENCGAPKPSAQKSAVCVRPVNEADASRDRRPRQTMPDTHGFEGQGYSRTLPYATGASPSGYSRPITHSILPTEQRGNKSADHMLHQAHSLTMRGPGDEIPLLESTPRTTPYPFPDTQATHRLNQTLLNEPLINTGPISQHQDPKNQRGNVRQAMVGGTVDFNQKIFPGYTLDRDQLALPSMNGIQGQQPQQSQQLQQLQQQPQQPQMGYPGQTVAARRSQLDFSSHHALPQRGKGDGQMLPEEVINFNRSNFMAELDTRTGPVAGAGAGTPRFQNYQGIRTTKDETGQSFPGSLDGQGGTTYSYPPGQEFFPSAQGAVRQEERLSFEESRAREGLSGAERTKQGINLRYMENVGGREDRHRVQAVNTSRADVITGQLRGMDGGTGNLEEARHGDEGRFAIENILMQHKNGRSNQG